MNEQLINSVALVVVDMQDGFLKAIPDADALISRCSFAVEAARLLGIRTCFTAQVPEKLGEVTPRLTALNDQAPAFSKTAFSVLGAPGLKEFLEETAADHIILAGIETPICVYQSAIDAVNEDLSVTLLADCIGGRREGDRQPVFSALAQTGCHILPSETVFYSILGDAEHPAFRTFTKLVKKYSNNQTGEAS